MKVTLDWLEDEHMEAHNEQGGSIRIDGSTEIGGIEGGMSPMQLLLAAVAGCSTIDIIGILKKQRQELDNLHVEVDANKEKVDTYSEFKTINLNYTFSGNLEESKVERAIELSLGKYCSVSKALEKTSDISYRYEIISND